MELNERNFPNHVIERDIGLAEYGLASRRIDSEEKSFVWATNTASIIASASVYMSFKLSSAGADIDLEQINFPEYETFFLAVVFVYSLMSIIYLANLLKSKTIAERKIVVLRRNLGLSYGMNTLVLPNWRLEGADHPFSIKLFSGIMSYKTIPVHIILIASSFSIFQLFDAVFLYLFDYLPITDGAKYYALLVWYALGLTIYRYQLYDNNENWKLSLANIFAKLLFVNVIRNVEHKIYRIRLDVAEANRTKADFETIREIVKLVEDSNFERHRGISFRGIGRAIYNKIRGRRATGGSTITQQFARSNFIRRPSPTIRRKIVEILLARWIESKFSKHEILDSYLCTARFERNIYGFHRAFKHFFGESAENITKVESFILVERLGNIRGHFLGWRIFALLNQLNSQSVLSKNEIKQILCFYQTFMDHHWSKQANELSPAEILAKLNIENASN